MLVEDDKSVSVPRIHFVLLGASLAGSCGRPPAPFAEDAGQEQAIASTEAFRRDWLAPAKIAPPTIDFVPVQVTRGSWTITATPALPEEAPWNAWPGPEARLFNNRSGLMFAIATSGEGPVRWLPEGSRLRVNHAPTALAPSATPDELLVPLLGAALEAERHVVDSDLVDRTRAAGPFRAAYLSTAAEVPPTAGVVVFPLQDPEAQVVYVELTLAFDTPAGPTTFLFTWE